MTGLAILEWRKEKYRKEDRGNRFGFGEYKEVYLRMYVGGNELKELLRKHVEESEEISPTY